MRRPLLLRVFAFVTAVLAIGFGAVDASAATVVVTDASDATHACAASGTGTCSLRDAITFANANGGTTIHFNIAGAGVQTITPLSALPNITAATTIDGYTQPGASPNSNGPGLGDNAILRIELDGVNTSFTGCLVVGPTTGGGTAIQGLAINRCVGSGIQLSSSTGGNTVRGNFIGTDPTGTIARGIGGSAVQIFAQTVVPESNDVIGGPNPADRNVLSAGALFGISAGTGSGHLIRGNFIGTDATGLHALPGTQAGIGVDSANDTIGGTTAGARNVISGNSGSGVSIGSALGDPSVTANIVEGNFIGTDVTGTMALPNGGNGITINGLANTIGGTVAGAGNVISGNLGYGVSVVSGNGSFVQGNLIGTDLTGTAPLGNAGRGVDIEASHVTVGGTAAGSANVIAFNGATNGIGGGVIVGGGVGNTIRGNSISGNTSTVAGRGLGIDLGGDGVTPNDPCDADTGVNNLQNFPILTTAFSSAVSTMIQGTLNSVASTTYQVEFFSNAVCDPSGHGEGQTFIGSTMVTTDPSCNGSFNVTLPVSVAPTTRLTATATDPAGNTSEFSACISLQAEFHTVQPCRVADTRGAAGPYGGPALNTNGDRSFVIAGQCGIPSGAQAVAFNFTIVQPTSGGHITVYPGGGVLPVSSTMNYSTGQIRANNAIVPLGPSGDVLLHLGQSASTTSNVVIDVNGYFE